MDRKKPIDGLFSPIERPSRARWVRDGRMSRADDAGANARFCQDPLPSGSHLASPPPLPPHARMTVGSGQAPPPAPRPWRPLRRRRCRPTRWPPIVRVAWRWAARGASPPRRRRQLPPPRAARRNVAGAAVWPRGALRGRRGGGRGGRARGRHRYAAPTSGRFGICWLGQCAARRRTGGTRPPTDSPPGAPARDARCKPCRLAPPCAARLTPLRWWRRGVVGRRSTPARVPSTRRAGCAPARASCSLFIVALRCGSPPPMIAGGCFSSARRCVAGAASATPADEPSVVVCATAAGADGGG